MRPRPTLARSRSTLLAILLCALSSTAPSLAAPKAPTNRGLSLEQVLAMKQVQGLTWSRDGRKLAFTVAAPDTAENTTNQDIWMWEAGTDSCRVLTRHAKNDYAPQFSPGGDTLAFGSTTGSLWVTEDQGERWQTVSEHLPPVYAIRFA